MSEPTNKPLALRASLGLSQRPFATVACISLLAVLVGFYESRGATEAVFAAEQWASGIAGSFPVAAVLIAVVAVLVSVLAYRILSRRAAAGDGKSR